MGFGYFRYVPIQNHSELMLQASVLPLRRCGGRYGRLKVGDVELVSRDTARPNPNPNRLPNRGYFLVLLQLPLAQSNTEIIKKANKGKYSNCKPIIISNSF
jgi:hypothetical protein